MSVLPTVRQVISDVRQDLNRVTLDGYLTAKYLHSKLLDKAKLFMKREADDRKLQLAQDIWVTINDFEMEDSSLVGCADIAVPHCTRIMISKKALPEIYTTRYGFLMNVQSMDYSRPYIQTTPREYAKIKQRRFQNPNLRYFWIYNNKLVIPESMVESVTVRAIFCDKAEGLKVEGCNQAACIRTLDQTFTVPEHMLDDVKNATVLAIAGIRDKIPQDTYPGLNELVKTSPVKK